MEEKVSIAIIDDDAALVSNLKDILEAEGYSVEAVADGRAGIALFNEKMFDLALVDIKLPHIPGPELVSRLSRLRPETEYVMITGHATMETAIEAVRQKQVIGYENKPIDMERLLTFIRQVIRRRWAEEALRISETNYRTIFDTANDAILICDFGSGRIIDVNRKMCEMYGYTVEEARRIDVEVLSEGVPPYSPKEAMEWIQKAANGTPQIFEWKARDKDGKIFWVEMNLKRTPIGDEDRLLAIVRNINERKRAGEERIKIEAQLQQAQKMEAIGALAGGIAHNFNNLLSVILANISLAQDKTKPEVGTSEFLKEAEKASIRAGELTTRLITFSRGGEPVKKVTCIGELVKDSVSSLLSGSDTDCEFSIADDLSLVEIDQGQMKHVIYNIVSNAREAMTGKGSIKVYCENVTIGEKDALTLKDGKYVRISMKDQGAGIPEENLSKIFDPYFSTKKMGVDKGMGLGLSICHSIVEKHGGLITVESEPGMGTTLFIYLPASDKEMTEPEPVKKPIAERPVTGGGKILVMDDEEMIRQMASQILSLFGYDAEVSKDGVEAIEMYKKAKESGEPFDAVILDLTIEFGMGGTEAIQKLIEIDPDVKAIVSTGYSNDPVVAKFREYGFRGALTKPYTIDELNKTLHKVVSGE